MSEERGELLDQGEKSDVKISAAGAIPAKRDWSRDSFDFLPSDRQTSLSGDVCLNTSCETHPKSKRMQTAITLLLLQTPCVDEFERQKF